VFPEPGERVWAGTGANRLDGIIAGLDRLCSCAFLSKASINADVVELPAEAVVGWTGAGIST
jgi:hypothetical protein